MGTYRVYAAQAVSASIVFYSPGEPLESGPEQRNTIRTWQCLPSSERSGSLGKRGGWRLLFVASAAALRVYICSARPFFSSFCFPFSFLIDTVPENLSGCNQVSVGILYNSCIGYNGLYPEMSD